MAQTLSEDEATVTLTEFKGKRIVRSAFRPSKIIALGRNYSEHMAEMKEEPEPEPIFFLKPVSSIVHDKGTVIMPSLSKEVQYEVELAVVIGKKAKAIPQPTALDYVYGYTIMLDMTARDLQRIAIERRLPYALSKGFDTFAPIYHIMPKRRIPDPHNLDISLSVNGELRQKSNTRNMIFKIPHIISYLSNVMALDKGDIISTGTPSGVSPLKPGDVMTATIEKIGTLTVSVK